MMVNTLALPRELALAVDCMGEIDSQDLTCNLQTEESTLAESLESIDRGVLILIATMDDDVATGNGLLGLGASELGDGDRSWDGHDGSSDQVLRGNAKGDVGGQHGTSDSRETLIRSHMSGGSRLNRKMTYRRS